MPRFSTTPEMRVSVVNSRLFQPQNFFCDDIPVISPYRDSTPEAGLVFEHPIHEKWDVDVMTGSIVVVRPDGHIGVVTRGFGTDAWQNVQHYFEGFLIGNDT